MDGKCEFPSHHRNITQSWILHSHPSLWMPERGEEHVVLSCSVLYRPVTPSADELPYFQCFFVDEDEAQFPFYAFSPLQIWSFSLNPAWGLQFSQFTDNDKVTSRHVTPSAAETQPAVHCWSSGEKPGRQRRTGDFNVMDRFYFYSQIWLSSRTKYMHLVSFLSIYFFYLFFVFNSFERWITWEYLNGTI